MFATLSPLRKAVATLAVIEQIAADQSLGDTQKIAAIRAVITEAAKQTNRPT